MTGPRRTAQERIVARMKQYRIPHTIDLREAPDRFHNFAVGLYLLHMAVMANLTLCFEDALLRFRMPSFLLAALLALIAVGYRAAFRGVPLRALLLYLVFFSMAASAALSQPEALTYMKDILFSGSFVKFALLFSLVFVFEEEPETRVRQLTVISIVSLLVYQLGVSRGVFVYDDGKFAYMPIGYGAAPWWCIVAQGVFYYKNKFARLICLVTAAYFAVFIATYGNRGALVVVLAALAVFLVVYVPLKHLVLLGGFAVLAIMGALLFLEPIMGMAGKFLGFDLTQSRTFRLVSSGRLWYDSGRFPIYKACFGAILRSPLLGNGAGGDFIATSSQLDEASYAHNIVIELCVDFGVVAGALVYIWLLYIGARMLFKCRDRSQRALFLPFYVFSMIKLFFSGTFYESGYLLASVMIYAACSSRSQSPVRRNGESAVQAVRISPSAEGGIP